MAGTIDSVLSKIDNPMLGQALGFFMTELQMDRHNKQPMMGTLMAQIQGLMTQPHFPNISHVISDLTVDYWAGGVFKPAIIAGIAGWLLDEVDMNPTISRMGKTLKTLGFNGALGVVAAVLLDQSSLAFSDGGADHGMHHQLYQKPQKGWAGHFTMPTVGPTKTLSTPVAGVPRPN